jgi:plastocyanin
MKTAIVILAALAAVLPLSRTAMATQFTVDITNYAFTPHGTHIGVGDNILWSNMDNVPHAPTADNGSWGSSYLSHNQTYSHTFSASGAYPYHCAVHPDMMDTIFVGVQSGTGDLPPAPRDFELSPNYPNPFNAQTTIKYSLSQDAHVNIEIYNVLGQEVKAILDNQQTAGEHQIAWDASGQTSGVFFYRVNVDGQIKMGRMMLLK